MSKRSHKTKFTQFILLLLCAEAYNECYFSFECYTFDRCAKTVTNNAKADFLTDMENNKKKIHKNLANDEIEDIHVVKIKETEIQVKSNSYKLTYIQHSTV